MRKEAFRGLTIDPEANEVLVYGMPHGVSPSQRHLDVLSQSVQSAPTVFSALYSFPCRHPKDAARGTFKFLGLLRLSPIRVQKKAGCSSEQSPQNLLLLQKEQQTVVSYLQRKYGVATGSQVSS